MNIQLAIDISQTTMKKDNTMIFFTESDMIRWLSTGLQYLF